MKCVKCGANVVEGYFSQSQGFNCVTCWEEGNSMAKKQACVRTDLSFYDRDQLLLVVEVAKELLKKSKPKKSTLGPALKARFIKFYEAYFGVQYYWTAKDAKAVDSISRKIKTKLDPALAEDESALIYGFEAFILRTLQLKDAWINEHFTPGVIDSQFNQIYLKIKNGKAVKSTVTDSFRERVARQANS